MPSGNGSIRKRVEYLPLTLIQAAEIGKASAMIHIFQGTFSLRKSKAL